ncbi:hypothetical protein [Variovorax sp. DT-64]|uniref:hypothetical protein n=1 Tax=Variovorax sp. DT-64 TaxID=3396160 RepID=UPI003F198EAC
MVDSTRRIFTSWLAATAAGMAPASVLAQAAKPAPAAAAAAIPRLRIVIPANEGGGWDQTGRALGAAMLAAGAVAQVSAGGATAPVIGSMPGLVHWPIS